MIELENVKPFGILNKSNIISNLKIFEEHVGVLVNFINERHAANGRILYHVIGHRDNDGVTFSFGGYCGHVDCRLSNADILQWYAETGDPYYNDLDGIIENFRHELAVFAGLQHIGELVAMEIKSIGSNLSDLSLNVKNGAPALAAFRALQALSESIDNDNVSIKELKSIAKIAISIFNSVFRLTA